MATTTPTTDTIETVPQVGPEMKKRGRGRPPKPADERKNSPEYALEKKKHVNEYMRKQGDKALANKKYVCLLCDKCFKSGTALKYHSEKSQFHK